MANIFLSYKSEERSRALQFVEALTKYNFSIWWDTQIPTGELFSKVILREMEKADCIIVLWSKKSIDSDYILAEADYARNKKKIIPIMLEKIELPFPFGNIQSADFSLWNGNCNDKVFQKLLQDIHLKCDIKILKKDSLVEVDTTLIQKKSKLYINENQLWKSTISKNTKIAYIEYIETYPQGKYLYRAKRRMKSLIQKKQILLITGLIGLMILFVSIMKLGYRA